jgi:hypothetical protein
MVQNGSYAQWSNFKFVKGQTPAGKMRLDLKSGFWMFPDFGHPVFGR